MSFEISEAMGSPKAVTEWASKVVYGNELNAEEKEFNSYVDNWAKELGKTGRDPEHELSAMVVRALAADEVTAPSELIGRMFHEGNVDEFDDVTIVSEPDNTIQVHEAIPGGNVDRSFLAHTSMTPTWRMLQAETDISMQDLRRGGYRTIANMTNYLREALEYKRVAMVLNALDAAITEGNPNYIAETGAVPTEASADALALYLQDMSDGSRPFAFSLNKYRQAMSKLAQANRWPTDSGKTMYNTDGFLAEYAGMELLGFSGQKKQPDGSLLIPDKRVFGIAAPVGYALTRGEARVLQDTDIHEERIHLKLTGYNFGWVFTDPENAAKIVMAK